ncbi:MAG: hypothetical protein SFX72_16420 [Isosphaeraceae bacterium]|nr:hypothetical protein [Isosphaeraceae bacterium]
MFFPLVVIVAVLPGLYALSRWDLTPPGPWWGLRSLEVLDGLVLDQTPAALELSNAVESRAFRSVVQQPPLHAWLEALALRARLERDPMATVLPSYVAGALLVILVYLHGRLWRGPGVGVVAAVLTAFNHELLVEMQQASPVTLAVAGAASALYAYGRHLRAGSSSAASWNGPEGLLWVVVGGLGLGTSLMSMGLLGLLVIPIVGLHQFYLRAGLPPGERVDRWWLSWRDNVSLLGGGLVLAIALVLALPWHLMMANRHGSDFLEALVVPPGLPGHGSPHLLARLIGLAPATVALGLLAAGLAIRDALIAESDDDETIGGAFWVVWLAVAALTPNLWPTISPEAIDLLILIPLNLLAAQGIAGLANRRIPIRLLNAVAPATAGAIAWSLSGDLRNAVSELAHGRADSTTGLGLHLALDLIIAAVFLTRGIERWARRRDDRQRKVLAVFLISILAFTLADGLSQVTFQQKETRDLLSLRDVILRRNLERPIERVAVIAPDNARAGLEGGRLRFILRSALPHLRPLDLRSTDELIKRMEAPQGSDWLVVLVGTEQRLSYPIQSQLRLESIYPSGSGLLDAFASTKRAED